MTRLVAPTIFWKTLASFLSWGKYRLHSPPCRYVPTTLNRRGSWHRLEGGKKTSCHFVNVWHNLNVSWAVTPRRLSPCETWRRKKNISVSSCSTEELKKNVTKSGCLSEKKDNTSQNVSWQLRPGVFCLWRLGVAHEHFSCFLLF